MKPFASSFMPHVAGSPTAASVVWHMGHRTLIPRHPVLHPSYLLGQEAILGFVEAELLFCSVFCINTRKAQSAAPSAAVSA